MTRTVVVDLGGVLLRWDPATLIAGTWPDLAAGPQAVAELIAGVFQGGRPGADWLEYDRGALEPAALVERIRVRTGLPAGRLHELLDAIPGHLAVQPATAALLDRLQAEGVRLVYLSNMPARYADWLEGLPQFRRWFDGGVFSARVGHLKPEPQIYALAERRLGLVPERTLMLDDRADNVAAALRRGWSAAVFVDAASAAADLTARGWLG